MRKLEVEREEWKRWVRSAAWSAGLDEEDGSCRVKWAKCVTWEAEWEVKRWIMWR